MKPDENEQGRPIVSHEEIVNLATALMAGMNAGFLSASKDYDSNTNYDMDEKSKDKETDDTMTKTSC